MVFTVSDWPAGKMTTPTLAGTRPGGAIAAAWAVMNFLGVEGYRVRHGQVTRAREQIEAGVRERGFTVIGAPQLGIVAFTHPEVDGLAILGKLYQRGWVTSAITEPRGLHLMLSPVHLSVADQYLADLDWATEAARGETGAGATVGYGR